MDCKFCKYKTDNGESWKRHLTTKKHLRKSGKLIETKNRCETCKFGTSLKREWKRHIDGILHSNRQISLKCELCDIIFKKLSLLKKHKQSYKHILNENNEEEFAVVFNTEELNIWYHKNEDKYNIIYLRLVVKMFVLSNPSLFILLLFLRFFCVVLCSISCSFISSFSGSFISISFVFFNS